MQRRTRECWARNLDLDLNAQRAHKALAETSRNKQVRTSRNRGRPSRNRQKQKIVGRYSVNPEETSGAPRRGTPIARAGGVAIEFKLVHVHAVYPSVAA